MRAVAAFLVLASHAAVGQYEPWKIHVRADELADVPAEELEITSGSVLVTHEGERLRMSRCSWIAADDLAHLNDLIVQVIKTRGDDMEHRARLFDSELRTASLSFTFTPSAEFSRYPRYRFQLPIAAASYAESADAWRGEPPPLLVVELLESVWDLREAAQLPCEPAPATREIGRIDSQVEDWKLVAHRPRGSLHAVGVEIDSSGLLVTNEGLGAETPRCEILSAEDLSYLNVRIAQLEEYALSEPGPYMWFRDGGFGGGPGSLTMLSTSSERPQLGLRLPITSAVAEMSMTTDGWYEDRPPPLFIAELAEKVTQLSDAASAGCVPRLQ